MASTSNLIGGPSCHQQDQTSFASLPREIRDQIYALVVSQIIDDYGIDRFCLGGSPWLRSRNREFCEEYWILFPEASKPEFADEAREMMFKIIPCSTYSWQCGEIIETGGIPHAYNCSTGSWNVLQPGPNCQRLDVRPWLHELHIYFYWEEHVDDLAGLIEAFGDYPALRIIKFDVGGYLFKTKWNEIIINISMGYEIFAEKSGRKPNFTIHVNPPEDRDIKRCFVDAFSSLCDKANKESKMAAWTLKVERDDLVMLLAGLTTSPA